MSELQTFGPPSLGQLQSELSARLRDTTLSFVAEGDRHYLIIPGHLPIRSAPVPARATGTPFYEETTTIVLSYLLKRIHAAHFFDIGAAGGYFSRVAASLQPRAPEVNAFEMRPDQVRQMHQLLQSDPFADLISLHHAAVSDKDVERALVWQARSLLFEHHPMNREHREAWWRRLKFWIRNDRSRGLYAFSTDLTSVDGFVERSGKSPDIIKIDVEGYEGRVISGAKRTLRTSRPYILLELHSNAKQRFDMPRRSVVQSVLDQSYDAILFTDHQNKDRCEVVIAGLGDAWLGRQETDLVLFVPR